MVHTKCAYGGCNLAHVFQKYFQIEIICEVVVIINVFQALGSGNLQLIIWVNGRNKIHIYSK